MIDKKLQDEILESIVSAGEIDSKIHINGNLTHVLSVSSGTPRIQSNAINKFKLILSQPERLRSFSSFSIRCAVCKKVISYPAWYFKLKYSVNEFHYFVCFSETSPTKPNTHCLKG